MNALVSPVDRMRQGILLRLIRTGAAAVCITGVGALSQHAIATNSPGSESAAAVASNDANIHVDKNPGQLIESMSKALRTLNYEGVFVHAQGVNLTSMHILHSSNAKGEFERLSALDGEAREIFRNDSLVTCIWPGTKSVVVSKSKPRRLLPRIDKNLAMNPSYDFSLNGNDRVAGRTATIVNVLPLDEFRYGYRFWIDVETNMLLRSMLLEGANVPVEQVIFTQIEYPDSIDSSRFDIIAHGERGELASWLEPKKAKATSELKQQKSQPGNRVGFNSLPEGYRKISETFSSLSLDQGPMSHVMISDGMASVSVYVEYLSGDDRPRTVSGLSRMGAMNAYSTSTRAAFITAVGEVPEATVRAIAAAVILIE
ncbi:MAG: MucB/RseB C-terminal domain-containing protein [Granulosicoccus sp.]